MDISYLLFLQRVREGTDGIFSSIALSITSLGEPLLTYLLLAWIYWCVDKAAGQLIAFNISIACTYNQFIKNVFKVERPWVRDSRVLPVKEALAGAGGYSFPSGHTSRAVAVWGSAAAALWAKKEKLLSVLFWLIVLMVAFSRNFLGVHTPQDVVVSLVGGVLLIYILSIIQKWGQASGHDFLLCVIGCLVCFLPMLKIGCMSNAGAGMGFWIGWFLEKRLVRFDTCSGRRQGLFRFMPGALGILFLLRTIQTFFGYIVGAKYSGFFASFTIAVFIMAVYPLLFKLLEESGAKNKRRLGAAYVMAAVLTVFVISLAGYHYSHKDIVSQETADNEEVYPKVMIDQDFDVMRVIAHRGYSAAYPENTLAAFAGAIDIGADFIELDVQMTSDGVIVVFHDGDLMRMTGSEGTVTDCTYEYLQQLSIGGEKMPALKDALELIKASDCNVYLELKDIGEREGFVEQTLAVAEECGMKDRCIFASFQYEYLCRLKELDPDILTLYNTTSCAVSLPEEYPAEFYGMNIENVSAETVCAIHESGSRVFVWTVEAPTQIDMLRRMGVDGVVVNNAGMARVLVHPEYGYLVDNYEKSFALPGLYEDSLPEMCKDMVVQGFSKAGQYIVISAYSKSGEYNSILYIMDSGGTLLNVVDLQFKAHTGGIAYDENLNLLWVTGPDGLVYALDWNELVNNEYQGDIKVSFDAGLKNHSGSKVASFLTYDHGELFVGSYVDGSPGSLKRYCVSEDLQPELISELEIPQRIQGITFAWDDEAQKRYMLLSQGYQTEDSRLLQFVYSDEISAYTEPDASCVMPEGMEQIDMSANGLYVLFESAAMPYRKTARIPNDQVYLLRWKAIEQ